MPRQIQVKPVKPKPAPTPPPTTCIEHGPGGTIRLSFQIKVF